MASSTPLILVIADISGYTDFMRRHPVVSSHAREITVRLLNSVISRSAFPLKVAEIEGDAVFFFAEKRPDIRPAAIESVKQQLIGFFRAFRAEAARLQAMDVCSCEACASVGSLVLKQVVHVGEATIERVSGFDKLFSLDVILVHRLLKNSVPSRQYILLTKDAYDVFEPFLDANPERHEERLEDVGSVESFVIRDSQLEALIGRDDRPVSAPGWVDRMLWRMKLRWSELRKRR